MSSIAVGGGASTIAQGKTPLVALLGGWRDSLSRLVRRHRPAPATHINNGKPAGLSASAVGVISNYGDQYFNFDLVERLRGFGVTSIVYSGPISTVDEPKPLWDAIQAGTLKWVYGQSERPKSAPAVGLLPGGPAEIEVNGILFRHFAPGQDPETRMRIGELQWPPPGQDREQAVSRAASGMTQPVLVIGSGLEFERWSHDTFTDRWELVEQNLGGDDVTTVARLTLPTDAAQTIVHPTSRGQFFSVIDPENHLMVLFIG